MPLRYIPEFLNVDVTTSNCTSISYRSLWLPATGSDMAKSNPCLSERYSALEVFLYFRPCYSTPCPSLMTVVWLPSRFTLERSGLYLYFLSMPVQDREMVINTLSTQCPLPKKGRYRQIFPLHASLHLVKNGINDFGQLHTRGKPRVGIGMFETVSISMISLYMGYGV